VPEPLNDSVGDERFSRRDFARVGLVAGAGAVVLAGGALATPNIRTIRFAGKVVGSVQTPPTSESTSPEVSVGGSTVPSTTDGSSTTSTTKPLTKTASTDGTSDGVLPFTGAAIGGVAIVGGAAVAVGRAMASAGKRTDMPQGQVPSVVSADPPDPA